MNKVNYLKLLLVLAIGLQIYGCKPSNGSGVPNVFGVWKSDRISQANKDSIRVLNEKILKAFQTKDTLLFKSTWSDTLFTFPINLQQSFASLELDSSDTTYTLFGEYYAKSLPWGAVEISSDLNNGIYSLQYGIMTSESYVSLLIPKTKHEVLISLFYGKYDDGWKLNMFRYAQYSLFGKNALDYYANAKSKYKDGNLIGAGSDIILAKRCLKPTEELFHYVKEKEISDFYDKLVKEVNQRFNFPITISKISTQPTIYNFDPTVYSDGAFPLISYKSQINLKDTISLKKENQEVQNVISSVLPGITENKKIYYRVYNSTQPSLGEGMTYYGFVQEIK